MQREVFHGQRIFIALRLKLIQHQSYNSKYYTHAWTGTYLKFCPDSESVDLPNFTKRGLGHLCFEACIINCVIILTILLAL